MHLELRLLRQRKELLLLVLRPLLQLRRALQRQCHQMLLDQLLLPLLQLLPSQQIRILQLQRMRYLLLEIEAMIEVVVVLRHNNQQQQLQC
jgi:hypothetical protein